MRKTHPAHGTTIFLAALAALLVSCGETNTKNSNDEIQDPTEDYCKNILSLDGCYENDDICKEEWCDATRQYCTELPNDVACFLPECASDLVCDCSALSDSDCQSNDFCKDNCGQSHQPQKNCTPGQHACSGFKNILTCVMSSDGDTSYESSSCGDEYCIQSSDGKDAACVPACVLKNGATATVLNITDGDTITLLATPKNGECSPYYHSVRIHGIDSPECVKEKVSFSYEGRNYNSFYTCRKEESYYSNGRDINDPYGYEAMLQAKEFIKLGDTVTVFCDKTVSGGECGQDDTEHRYLSYLQYTKDNASYDFSTEMARAGASLANTDYYSQTSKIKQICKAMGEAQKAKRGMWAAGSIESVLDNIHGKAWTYNMQHRCDL